MISRVGMWFRGWIYEPQRSTTRPWKLTLSVFKIVWQVTSFFFHCFHFWKGIVYNFNLMPVPPWPWEWMTCFLVSKSTDIQWNFYFRGTHTRVSSIPDLGKIWGFCMKAWTMRCCCYWLRHFGALRWDEYFLHVDGYKSLETKWHPQICPHPNFLDLWIWYFLGQKRMQKYWLS